jgi:hypothetical protein
VPEPENQKEENVLEKVEFKITEDSPLKT